MEKHIQLPLTEEVAKTLHAGDSVYLTGTIYIQGCRAQENVRGSGKRRNASL